MSIVPPLFYLLGLQSSAFDATDLFHKEVEPIHGSCFFQALQSSAADVNQLFHKRGKQFMGIDSMGFLQILQSSAVDANHLVHKKM